MMDQAAGTAVARALLDGHGLHSWTIRWTDAQRSFGTCHHATTTIRLSWPIARLNGPEQLRLTVLHEVAHARAGPGAGHCPAWRAECRQLGIPADRCLDARVAVPPGRWTGTCRRCGFTTTRIQLRKAARNGTCPRCDRNHNPAFALIWTRTTTD